MKKNYLLILMLLFVFRVSGQTCQFTYQTNPGTTIVQFAPDTAFQSGNFMFRWNLGDGSTDLTMFPVHTYNGMGPFIVCCEVIDPATGDTICTSCDSIALGTTVTCMFSYSNVGNTFTFTAINPIGTVTWDFGDNTSDTGHTVTHTYNGPGVYTVSMTSLNPTCQSVQSVVVAGGGNCSFGTTLNGNSAAFYLNFSGAGAVVFWDFGDGSTGTGTQTSHTYSGPGFYNVCVNVTDTAGISCQSCQGVLINTTTNNCYFSYAADPVIQNAYNFTAVPAYSNSGIIWDFGDGSNDTGLYVSHIYATGGTYSVCMTEFNSGAPVCTSCSTVVVNGGTPQCSFNSAVSIINPLTVNFQANGAFASTVTWDFGDGSTDTGLSVSHTYTTAGIYQICMTTGVPGTTTFCTSCNIVAVGNSMNYCNITYYPDPLSPNTFVFSSNQSSSSSMIAWDFGDNTIGIGQSVTHTYSTAGNYNVCITERDSAQNIICQSCVSIQVSNGGASCQAAFLATSYGFDGYFIDMSVTGGAGTQYSWDFGDGSTSTLQFPQHTFALTGLYNVCLTVSDTGCSDTFCAPLLIDTANNPTAFGCNAFYAFIQLSPYQVTVVNLSSGVNLNFDWDFGDGSPHDSNAYPSHFYSSTGVYVLSLTVSDNNGCSSTYSDTLSVDSLGNIYRRSTPGFTLNVVSPAQLTGVNEISAEKQFNVYPNPFNSKLQISVINAANQAKEYRIFSIEGAEVLNGKLNGINGIIDTQSLTSGIYLLEISMTDGSRSFQRVVKN